MGIQIFWVSARQNDRGLKTTLNPIVSKLSDMRIVNGRLEYLVFGRERCQVDQAHRV